MTDLLRHQRPHTDHTQGQETPNSEVGNAIDLINDAIDAINNSSDNPTSETIQKIREAIDIVSRPNLATILALDDGDLAHQITVLLNDMSQRPDLVKGIFFVREGQEPTQVIYVDFIANIIRSPYFSFEIVERILSTIFSETTLSAEQRGAIIEALQNRINNTTPQSVKFVYPQSSSDIAQATLLSYSVFADLLLLTTLKNGGNGGVQQVINIEFVESFINQLKAGYRAERINKEILVAAYRSLYLLVLFCSSLSSDNTILVRIFREINSLTDENIRSEIVDDPDLLFFLIGPNSRNTTGGQLLSRGRDVDKHKTTPSRLRQLVVSFLKIDTRGKNQTTNDILRGMNEETYRSDFSSESILRYIEILRKYIEVMMKLLGINMPSNLSIQGPPQLQRVKHLCEFLTQQRES